MPSSTGTTRARSLGLAAALFVAHAAAAAPPTTPVTVVNAAANPVPTVAQGTTTVSGSVTVANSVQLAAGTSVDTSGSTVRIDPTANTVKPR